MKSTLFNMVAVLFVITLLASGGVGAVYMITKEPIAVAQQNATREALKLVLPPFDATVDEAIEVDELPVTVHTATAADQVVGYAVETMTKNGFSGVVRLMVGFTPDGEVINIQVLEQSETPGLGTKMADEGNPLLLSFQGKYPAQMNMSVKKDGGDVDALTAATISSRAYVDAVRRAYNAYVQKVGGEHRVLPLRRLMIRLPVRQMQPQSRLNRKLPWKRKEVKMNNLKVLTNGIIKNNPTFVLVLGMCPTLGTTTSAANGFGMGAATMAVLVMSNLVISLIKNLIPDKVRIPAFIVVIASFVTIIQMLMQAYVPSLYASLGVFIPLIVVNCIILGRAEAFASKNGPIASIFDGLGIGLGFTCALTLIGAVREILGSGAIFGYSFGVTDYMPLVFVLAPGAFFVLGYLMALFNKVVKKNK